MKSNDPKHGASTGEATSDVRPTQSFYVMARQLLPKSK